MAIRRTGKVVDQDGVRGLVRDFVGDDVVVELEGGSSVAFPSNLLHIDDDGGYTIVGSWRQFLTQATSGVRIPVIEERLVTGVRRVPGETVRVRRRVVTEHKKVETPVWREHIVVERIEKDELVERAPEPRQDGDTLVIACVEEVAVVEKRLRLRAEIRIRVVREKTVEVTAVELRRHELEIERDGEATPHLTKPKKHEGGAS